MGSKMDVGTELRSGRERRGISLAVLASKTKIGVATLQAMERGDFARLPGGIFTRGFLRAYAREVGLNPEEMVQHYLAEFEPPPPAEPTAYDGGDVEDRDLSPVEMEELERRNSRRQLIGGAVVLLLGPFLYFTFLGRHSGGSANVEGQLPPPAAVNPAKAEVGTTGSGAETSVASRDIDRWADRLHLEIRPTGACWVSAVADGRQQLHRLMAAGERETIEATDQVMLRIGDPSTCVYSINGTLARQAANAGQAVTLHITRQNYRDFLNPASSAAGSGAPPDRPGTAPAANGPPAAPIPPEPAKARRLSPPPPTTGGSTPQAAIHTQQR
jgi:cytoskeleton protein RodZ